MSEVVVVVCPNCSSETHRVLYVRDNVCFRCGKLFHYSDLECVRPAQLAVYHPKKKAGAA